MPDPTPAPTLEEVDTEFQELVHRWAGDARLEEFCECARQLRAAAIREEHARILTRCRQIHGRDAEQRLRELIGLPREY